MRTKIFKSSALALCFLLICAALPGCRRQVSGPQVRVVTQIDVSGSLGIAHYTSNEKMEQILNCLRLIRPLGQPSGDPAQAAASDICITLHYSDGQQASYHQRSDCYWLAQGKWTGIDPKRGEALSLLLSQLPGDGETSLSGT